MNGSSLGMSVLAWEPPGTERDQDAFEGKESKPGWLPSTARGEEGLRGGGGR